MSIYISHRTALWLMCSPGIWPLVAGGSGDAGLKPAFGIGRTSGIIAETRTLLPRICALAEWEEGHVRPLDMLVPKGASRRKNDVCVRHSWGRALPENAVVRLDEGVYLSTPEFAFLPLFPLRGTDRICQATAADDGQAAVWVSRPVQERKERLEGAQGAEMGARGIKIADGNFDRHAAVR
jgi:hypothetical protein